MSNEFYNRSAAFAPRTKARSENVRDELDSVSAGFDKLPAPDAIQSGSVTYAADTGAADAYVIDLAKAPTAYTDGMTVLFKAGNANTGAATLNVNSLGVKPLVRQDGTALRAGDINATEVVQASYNGTHFRLVSSTSKMVSDAETAATSAAASASAASASASSASNSASAASTSETNAATSAGAAGTSATNAANSETAAAASASSASTSAANAASSASSASSSAGSASTSATSAADSALAAVASASNAATSETNAAASASAAATSEANAAASAAAAATFNPSSYYLKTEVDAKDAAKADLTGADFTGGVSTHHATVTSTTNSTVLNLSEANSFKHVLTENTTLSITNVPVANQYASFTVDIVQDAGASGFAVTWFSGVIWPSATAPTLTATASAVDTFVFKTYDAGTTWYGFVAGQAMGAAV